ncbi:MAG: phosphotransferase [Thermoleophilia bacterium]|nr:phosphotransferase [Thermoleophilia bacterium]
MIEEWRARAPALAAACAEAWSLRLGEAYEHGHASLTLRAELPDGTPVVLKVGFPHAEAERESDALLHYGGRGAVRLLAHDPERNALLLERCEPGTSLWEVEDDEEAMSIAASVLRRLWSLPPAPDHSFRVLADEADAWLGQLRADWDVLGRPFERALVDAAVAAVRELAPSQPRLVLCHQDFQGSNVLRAEREPWLAIDPKPTVGEPAFDVASLLRDRRWDVRAPVIRRRLDLLAGELELDRERLRGWGIVHALYWGVDGGKVEEDMLECARILLTA